MDVLFYVTFGMVAGVVLLVLGEVVRDWRRARRRKRAERLLAQWTQARKREAFKQAFTPTNGKVKARGRERC